jgi:phospholipase D1/2
VTAILIVRILPVAPFTVVNVMAGASEVRFRDFILATFLGMLPGLLVMTFFGNRLESAIRDPNADSFMILVSLVVALVLVMAWLRRRFVQPDSRAATGSASDEGERARLRCRNSTKHARCFFGGLL